MEILQQEDGKKGKFYILVENVEAAEMTYVYAGEKKIIIDHTEVGEALKGSGAGKRLVEAAVEWARKEGVSIIPLCPFAKAVMEKNREKYADVLA